MRVLSRNNSRDTSFVRYSLCVQHLQKVKGTYQQNVVPGEVDKPTEVFARAGATLTPEQQSGRSTVGVQRSRGGGTGQQRSVFAT